MNKCLIELDCLIDTRIGVIAFRSEEVAAEFTFSDTYRERLCDDMSRLKEGFNQAEFDKDYASRTPDTAWGGARITPMAYRARDMIRNAVVSEAIFPIKQEAFIYVNAFPYDEEEVRLAWFDVLSSFFETRQVHFVSKSPEELTPKYIRSSFNSVVMYDFDGWLLKHHEALKTCAMPSVSIHCPAILKSFTKTDLRLFKQGFAVDAIREAVATKLQLKMDTLDKYSMIKVE